jgi:hypothetical protein
VNITTGLTHRGDIMIEITCDCGCGAAIVTTISLQRAAALIADLQSDTAIGARAQSMAAFVHDAGTA